QGTPLGNAAVAAKQAQIEYIKNDFLSRKIQRKQVDFLNDLNRMHQEETGPNQILNDRIGSFELAFRMQ
ncbi:MAG TPA: DUF1501 domain-containing protein, partial [Planctomycetaceae bacterium]|nr:DUF1501 domain-containing protein [Planctomycetaceae bacterium]